MSGDFLLADLPDGFVQSFDVVRDFLDALNGSVDRNDLEFHLLAPQVELGEIPEQVVVDDLELPAEDPPGADVAGVGLHGLVVAEDLGRGRRVHGGQQQRVAHSVLGNLRLQGDAPHVVLELAFAQGGSLVGFIGIELLCELTKFANFLRFTPP